MYQFKSVTDRIKRMKEKYRDTMFTLDAERALIVTDFYKKDKNMHIPAPIKRARTLFEVCSKMTIRVEDDEIIVGNLGKNYKGTTLWPETAGIGWLYKELDDGSFYTRERQEEPMNLPEEEKEKILSIREFWEENTMWHGMRHSMPGGIESIVDSEVFTLSSGGLGRVVATNHLIPNYQRVIEKGFGAVREEALQELNKIDEGREPCTNGDEYFFYKSIKIVCDAYITLANRYAEACRVKANEVKNLDRAKELEKMAESLEWIAENPARTFLEAVQATYLYQLFLYIDGNYQCPSLGRFDQYTYPYLLSELNRGSITFDEAQEIVDCFWIKIGCLFNARLRHTTKVTGAFSTFQHMTIGGCDKNGEDATNPVTYMCLEAPARLLLHEPPVSLRVSEDTPDKLFECAVESSRRAGGIPIFYNEDLIIDTLVEGDYYSLEDARDFGIVGCQEIGGSGNDYCASCSVNSIGNMNLGNILNISLNNGINPSNQEQCAPKFGYLYEMESFTEVKNAFAENLEFFTNWCCTLSSCMEFYHMREYPVPALSAMLDGCMDSGSDCVHGGAKYNSYGYSILGVATVIESLIAIKYLIFDEEIYTAKEFYDAWLMNWEGYGDMCQHIKAIPHHYGNNDPYADDIAKWVMSKVSEIVNSKELKRGRVRLGVFTASAHVEAGKRTWATPDGRVYGDSLSDAASPIQGLDKKGPTAVLTSASSYDHTGFSNGYALNLRFSQKTLSGENAIQKIKDMMFTYYDMGGMEVQYNIVSSDKLREAQNNPEKYRNLIVRVAGFSAYFIELATQLQNDIIARTEYKI